MVLPLNYSGDFFPDAELNFLLGDIQRVTFHFFDPVFEWILHWVARTQIGPIKMGLSHVQNLG